jgi:hypothetical protein
MTAALDKWNDKFSDLPLFSDKSHTGTGLADSDLDSFKVGMVYYVTLSQARVCKSDYNGDVQIEAEFTADGFRAKKHWYTLPMQDTDLKRDAEQVQWLTQRRMRDLELIHAAAIPTMYALYDVLQITGNERVYIGMDGKPMDKDAFATRRKVVEENLKSAVLQLHGMAGQPVRAIEGTKVYMLLVRNEKKPKYPYLNLYRTPPLSAPLFRAAEYADIEISEAAKHEYDTDNNVPF